MAETDGFSEYPVRELAEVPAVEVIMRAAVMLMSAAAERLGLGETDRDADESPYYDLGEARILIHALAGLVDGSKENLGLNAAPIRDALKNLQLAFREASVYPDEEGQGPGEKYTGMVKARRTHRH